MPALAERHAFLALWRKKLGDRVDWSERSVETIATQTEAFSFAYIKELVTTALTRTVTGEKPFDAVLERECAALRENMKTSRKVVPNAAAPFEICSGDAEV